MGLGRKSLWKPSFLLAAMAELVGIEVVNLHGKRWKLEDVTCWRDVMYIM
jgi:hypothetical protein